MQWEAEFFALQDSNNKLAGALREANAAAAQWRQQLEAQRAEAERLRQRVRAPLPPGAPGWPWRLCGDPPTHTPSTATPAFARERCALGPQSIRYEPQCVAL